MHLAAAPPPDDSHMATTSATYPTLDPASAPLRARSIIAGPIGNALEYYDWYVYSAFSIYFAKAFFPSGNQTAQLLNSAAVFAVGFIMRPVGSWAFGLYADRHGRRAALFASVLAMCLGSLVIGLTPGYATIGVAAPVILVLGRIVQGFSLGGEYASSATYLSEMAPAGTRGYYSSFVFATLSVGQLLALLVLVVLQRFVLTAAQLDSWGWRVPFLLGALLAILAVYLRSAMDETDSFRRRGSTRRGRTGLTELAKHPRACLTVVGLTLGGSVAFYAFTTYMQKFLVNTAGMDKSQATLVSTVTLFAFILLQPVLGALSDRIGRRPMLLAFGVLGCLCTVPLFTALSGVHDTSRAMLLLGVGLFIVSLYSSVSAIAKAEIFPVEVRALGVGLPYALTVSLFGGTSEYVALWLKSHDHESYFYWYVTAAIGVSLVTYIFASEPKSISHIDSD